MSPIVEIIAEDAGAEVSRAIDAVLGAYNAGRMGSTRERSDFAVVLRDPATRAITGGLYGVDGYGWAFIKLLVVPERWRGMGLGTRLVREAEAIAAARGYVGLWLDTFDFQARPFYEKLGYTLFGEIESVAGAPARYFLKKLL